MAGAQGDEPVTELSIVKDRLLRVLGGCTNGGDESILSITRIIGRNKGESRWEEDPRASQHCPRTSEPLVLFYDIQNILVFQALSFGFSLFS